MRKWWFRIRNFSAVAGLFTAFVLDNWDEHKPESTVYKGDDTNG